MKTVARSPDILVVGGGVAGVCAAVTAARQNRRTLLLEKTADPGGTAVAGMHRAICGLFPNGGPVPFQLLNRGLTAEICARLKHLAPGHGPRQQGKVAVLPVVVTDLVRVLQEVCLAEKKLEWRGLTEVIAADSDRHAVASVTIRAPHGETRLTPKAVIDCTGSGAVIRLSGAGYRISPPEQRQLSGFAVKIGGLRHMAEMTAIKVPYYLNRAVEEKGFPAYFRFTTFIPGDKEDEGIFRLNLPQADDGQRHDRARADARRVFRFLTRALPEFEKARIIQMAPRVVDREGPRMRGRFTLHADEVLAGKKFADGHVKNAWPVELWDPRRGPQYQYLTPGDHYNIPDRCLQSETLGNLFAAGRCISVSHRALGSTRVMGTCMALGERAGYLAAKQV